MPSHLQMLFTCSAHACILIMWLAFTGTLLLGVGQTRLSIAGAQDVGCR